MRCLLVSSSVGGYLLRKDMGGIESLTLYVFYVLVGQGLAPLFTQYFEVRYCWKLLQRWYYSKRLKQGKFCGLTQTELNEIYEGTEVNLFYRYCDVTRIYFVAVFFSYILPIGPVICLIYLILQFWLDKVMIMRRYKTLVRLNSELAIQILEFAEISLILFGLGNIFFHFAEKRELNWLEVLTLVVSGLLVLMPIMEIAKKMARNTQLLRPRMAEDEFDCPTRKA